jgi:MFS-type transporter involved in bile tolerance (Atg22 family)
MTQAPAPAERAPLPMARPDRQARPPGDAAQRGLFASAAADMPWSAGALPADLFQHRADRLIALARAAMALIAFLAIRLEPSQPEVLAVHARILMAAYVVHAMVLAVAFGGFRAVQRSSVGTAAHVIDIGVFTALMSLTAGPASPFFALFNFSLLAAALR